ncbi:MAG: PilZ domain-containing protein [Lachnospiraceae bacterium]|nr:PilZ domain-containing protein [Lachnospiraceae bacterium]
MTILDLDEQHPVTLVVTVGLKSKDLATTVAEVHSEYVLLHPILVEGRTVGFGDSCTIDFLYLQDQVVYAWHSVSLPLVKIKGNTYYRVELNGEAKPYNRRGSFRVYVGETMAITVFQSSGPQNFNVLVRDISESGFGFVSKEEYEVSRTIRLAIPLTDRKTLVLSATIVRRDYHEEKGTYNYGCKFVEPNSYLSSYLMAKQRERQQGRTSAYTASKKRW